MSTGTRHWATGDHWPVKPTAHRPLYLRAGGRLDAAPEIGNGTEAFHQAPMTTTDKVEKLTWATDPFTETQSVHGTGAAHLFVAIDQDDTNLSLRF